MAIVHTKHPGAANPGGVLKALRQKEKWTLSEVADRTGLPISTLSRLENGKMAMTYEKLLQICSGLGIDMSALIGSPAPARPRIEGGFRRTIARAGEGQSVETPTGNYLYVAVDMLNKLVTPIIGDVTARSIEEYDGYLRHAGEEYLFVLNGVLLFYTEAYAPARLEQGDSIYFDSSMGHAYVSASDAPCQVLSICAAPGGEALEHHPLSATLTSVVQAEAPEAAFMSIKRKSAAGGPPARLEAGKG